MSNYKLTYFHGAGRAEPIRIAFFLADVPFEDHRVGFPEFMSLKTSGRLPLGALPILEVDGHVFTQTTAMLRHVARLGDTGLYPSDPYMALVVDSALETLNDTLSHARIPSLREQDIEKKLAMRAELVNGPMKLVFSYLEGLVAAFGGPFLTGGNLSIGDLVLAQQILEIRNGELEGVTEEHLKPYPNLNALADAYLADPRIKAYSAK